MLLTDSHVRNAKPKASAYKLSDGEGMYLLVKTDGARYWRWDYRFAGKRRTLAFGVYPRTALANARTQRNEARALLAQGIDPSVARKRSKNTSRQLGEATFEAIAREWLHNQRQKLAPKYSAQILARLEADVFPQIGSRPIADIDAADLLDALRKIEKRGVLETARRLRQTCGQVFRYAVATGRAKQDPSGALRGALSSPGKKRGHKAIASNELPKFLGAIDLYDGDRRTSIALRLIILTFVRTGELRAATWTEFEGLEGKDPLWRIPAERMKMKREHIVPLAPRVVELLRILRALPGSDASRFLFPSPAKQGFMSNNTMLYAMYRMGYHGRATVHGFRAMASTALNEMGFQPDVIERQLAHEPANAVRAAYNRAEYLKERRTMMGHWADHIDHLQNSQVVPMRITL